MLKDQLQFDSSKERQYLKGIIILGGLSMKYEEFEEMDEVLQDLCLIKSVYLMPSCESRQGWLYAQRKYNKLLFPKSGDGIELCCNPQSFTAKNGLSILASCGENLHNLGVNCSLQQGITSSKALLKFSHFATTRP